MSNAAKVYEKPWFPYVILCAVNLAILMPAIIKPAFFCGDDLIYIFESGRTLSYYRYLTSALLKGLFHLFSFDPFGYRIVEAGMHIATMMCFYYMTVLVTKRRSVAFVAALLFSCHVLHLKVTLRSIWIDFGVIALLVIMACIAFFQSLERKKGKFVLRIVSLLLLIGAVFTNEAAGAIVAVFFFYYLFNTEEAFSVKKAWSALKLVFPHLLFFALFMEFSCNPEHRFGGTMPTVENVTNMVLCFQSPLVIVNFFTACFTALFTPFIYVATYEYCILYEAGIARMMLWSLASFAGFSVLCVWIKDPRYRFGFVWLFVFLMIGAFGNQGITLMKYVHICLFGTSYLLALLFCDGIPRLFSRPRLGRAVAAMLLSALVVASVIPCYRDIRVRFDLGNIGKKIYYGVHDSFSSAPGKAAFYIVGLLPSCMARPVMYSLFMFDPFFFKGEVSPDWYHMYWEQEIDSPKALNKVVEQVAFPVDDVSEEIQKSSERTFHLFEHDFSDKKHVFPEEFKKYVYAFYNNDVHNLEEMRMQKRSVTFAVRCPDARSIAIAGDFNGWQPAPLRSAAAGVWMRKLSLPHGTYRYKLCVDNEQWVTNPQSHNYLEHPQFGEVSVVYLPLVES